MTCDVCNLYFLFWTIFCPFTPPNNPKSQNYKKNEESPWRYHHFADVYQKLWSHNALFLKYGARQIDRQMDKQKKYENTEFNI